ncbi:hypothetical protein HS961_00170 [Comamonas piscis]|uniref:Uncharacterized protein n=1 Tax=Comamonas piscis TaxID=1562974 RepID=A0A7G5EBK3_9BURK|nr:hypothetical protein [Comamonas piscis]QMV71378.1 hypothetical protein HS961_00170 [Comamonas piscis]WSO34084.1 hypothetical protein VUJ63_00170 [Comamonas piscis]
MSTPVIDSLLLRCTPAVNETATALAQAALALLRDVFADLRLVRVAQQSQGIAYLYFELSSPQPLSAEYTVQAERRLQGAGIAGLVAGELSRLQLVMHRIGPAQGEATPVHYAVEMDPEAGWQDDLFAWYDQEHLPGLASVAGTAQAFRYLNLDHGPLSLACYDLVDAEVMGCPAWLAVRGTDWSARVRPHFTNTRRTMFDTQALA